MSSVKENLKKAMKIVKNHWVKGAFDNGMGRHCAVGALMQVAGCSGSWGVEAEEKELTNHLPPGFFSVIGFNDSILTGHKDIMKLFRKAIRDCK